MMENVPALFYNQICNKAFEVIGFVKDYLSNNYMGKYHKMKESNLSTREKIMINLQLSEYGITEDSYVYNGYIMNSSDRIILTNIEKDSMCLGSAFEYVADPKKPESLTYITSFIINKRILDNINLESEDGNIQILKLAYLITKRYFLDQKITEDTIINRLYKRSNLYYTPLYNTEKEYEFITHDGLFYIDYLISAIMVLDTMFDLKFGDINSVKSALMYHGSNNILNTCFTEIYNYAIDVNPDPDDYINIFKKFLNSKNK